MKYFIMMLALLPLTLSAHEMTPTYPKLEPSHVEGVLKTTMEMLNKRKDVEYYEVGVFDKDWKNVPFVTSYSISKQNIIELKYLSRVRLDIYIREKDKDRALYICSKSKIKKEDEIRTAILSRICSKIK